MRPPCPPPHVCVYPCIPQVSTYTTHTGEMSLLLLFLLSPGRKQ